MQVATISRQGRRESNDDVVFAADGLVVLADGMGGHAGGRQAATAAVGAALQQLTSPTELAIRDAFMSANAAVRSYRMTSPEHRDAGCTLTVVYLRQNPAVGSQVIVGHAGDSPAFLIRGGEMTLLTPPHTEAETLHREGRITAEEVTTHPGKHTLRRSVGATTDLDPDIAIVDLQDGDRLMVCSDGLLGVPDRRVLRDAITQQGSAHEVATALVTRALETSSDNVTVAVLDLTTAAGDVRTSTTR